MRSDTGALLYGGILPLTRECTLPGHYLKQVPRDDLKRYLSDRTVSISNVCCFIQKCLLDNAINKGVDFVASFRYLWIVRNDDYRFPDCVEFLKEAHYIARCSCIQCPCWFISQYDVRVCNQCTSDGYSLFLST